MRESPASLTIPAIAVAVVAPFVFAMTRIASRSFPLQGDRATLDLDVLESGRALPLLGSYSQYGFRHPGPLFIHWMAMSHALFGGANAYPLGMLLLSSCLAVIGVTVAARLAGRAGAIIALLAVAAVALGSGWVGLSEPWNPFVITMGVPVFVVTAVAAWRGDRWATLAMVVVSSLLVQSHVGNAGLCVAVITAVIGAQIFQARQPRRELMATWALSTIVGLALWAGPVVDLLRHGTGSNVFALAEFGSSCPLPRTGLRSAVAAGVRAFRPRPTWLGGTNAVKGVPDHGWPVWTLVVAIALMVIGRGLHQRRQADVSHRSTGWAGAQRAADIAWVGLVVSLVAYLSAVALLAIGRGPVHFYYTLHIEATAFCAVVFASLVIGVAGLEGAARRTSNLISRFSSHVLVGTLTLSLMMTFLLFRTADRELKSEEGPDPAISTILADLRHEARGHDIVVVSRMTEPGQPPEYAVSIELFVRMARDGLPVRVGPDRDPASGAGIATGLQVAVPAHLTVDRAGGDDLDVVLYAGDTSSLAGDWKILGVVPPGITVLVNQAQVHPGK